MSREDQSALRNFRDLEHAESNLPLCAQASLHVQQTPSQSDRHRMGPIIRLELVDDIFDVETHGRFRYSEVSGNLFVAQAIADKSKNIQFTGR
jgi:hypothetical protein